jgi:hypothetical protein
VILPHHRTCRFQHPAVEPSGVLCRSSSVVTRRANLHRPSVGLRWLHHRALLRRKDSDRSYRVLTSRLPMRFPTPVSPLALVDSSALRSARLSPCLFATMASADCSGVLTPELSPGKVSALSKRAVWLYLMRLGGLWASRVPRQLAARTRPLCQFVFLRSLLCLPERPRTGDAYHVLIAGSKREQPLPVC